MRGLGGLLSDTGLAQTVERLAYGEPLTKGTGFATRMKPETANAVMALAPEAVPIGRAAMAGVRATKGLPVGASTEAITRGMLPSPKSLTMPSVPTVEQMQKYGRTEVVPLSQAVSFQTARKWDKFNAGEHPGDLVAGFGDKPLALRLETGEYVIYDGNHRTDLALKKGETKLPMYVIDVKSYDPAHAGRRPAPEKMSDDDLLKALLGEQAGGLLDR